MVKINKQVLREHGIFNSHNLATKLGNKLYLSYLPAEYGRASKSAQWQVVGINFQTNPNAHWADYGCKTFAVWGRSDKQLRFEEAIQWVRETYNLNLTDKDPFGGYHIEGTMKNLKLFLQGNGQSAGAGQANDGRAI